MLGKTNEISRNSTCVTTTKTHKYLQMPVGKIRIYSEEPRKKIHVALDQLPKRN